MLDVIRRADDARGFDDPEGATRHGLRKADDDIRRASCRHARSCETVAIHPNVGIARRSRGADLGKRNPAVGDPGDALIGKAQVIGANPHIQVAPVPGIRLSRGQNARRQGDAQIAEPLDPLHGHGIRVLGYPNRQPHVHRARPAAGRNGDADALLGTCADACRQHIVHYQHPWHTAADRHAKVRLDAGVNRRGDGG